MSSVNYFDIEACKGIVQELSNAVLELHNEITLIKIKVDRITAELRTLREDKN